ncbi:MAG TPA: hypothetical protein VFY13_02340 [Luteolibacter sp.]|nr:hypothetical protein [Luteolibacter sp.]
MPRPAHSLLELLCVLGVCAVLLGALAGGSRTQVLRVDASVGQLSALLEEARALARIRQRAVGCVLQPGEQGSASRIALCEWVVPADGQGEVLVVRRHGEWIDLGRRWRWLDRPLENACNPLAQAFCRSSDGSSGEAPAWLIGFNEFGRLTWPQGDGPVVLRMVCSAGAASRESAAQGGLLPGEQWLWLGRGVSRGLWITP